MTEKPRTPFIATTRAEGLVVGGAAIAFSILAGIFVDDDRGSIAGISTGAIAALICIAWPVRKEFWFWIAVAIFIALHVFAVAHFDWSFTHAWSGHAISSLIFPDVAVMMGIVYGLYRLKYGAPTELVADLPDEPRYGEREIDL
jgi:hypothetical protein